MSRFPDSLVERLQEGRSFLQKITGKDFGYDLAAWHNHLKESREGGYTYGRTFFLPKIMAEAFANPEWQAAVKTIALQEATVGKASKQ